MVKHAIHIINKKNDNGKIIKREKMLSHYDGYEMRYFNQALSTDTRGTCRTTGAKTSYI
jgi:hypothetical protein